MQMAPNQLIALKALKFSSSSGMQVFAQRFLQYSHISSCQPGRHRGCRHDGPLLLKMQFA
jgi:hypothetical protein